jgi:transcriptional regulator with XRE-family HTH domain
MLSQEQLGQKIRELREHNGLSQGDLAGRIGVSRVAVSDIERGVRTISALELARLVSTLDVSMASLFDAPVMTKSTKDKSFQPEFREDVLRNVLLYILEKSGGKPNVGETVLYKLLYFLDFDYFEVHGRPVTGLEYLRLQYGPVPAQRQFAKAVQKMKANGDIEIISREYHGKRQKRYIALTEADLIVIAPYLRAVDEIIERYSSMNASTIEAYSHGDIPWKVTADKEIIDYRLVFDRTSPYARTDHLSAFANAGALDIDHGLGSVSQAETDYYSAL